jgi:large subunit ribosomal protein L21
MFAIIRNGGHQYRAEPGKTIRIQSMDAEPGATVRFEEVLLGADGDSIKVGAPVLSGAAVTAEVVRHGKGEKIIIFKHKRRKNYRRKQGHRQRFTEVRVSEINLG